MRSPPELLGGNVHHAASGHRRRGRNGEILHLEEHAHRPGVEFDALAVGKTQGAVIIEHRVHVFDPDGVDRPVKDDPLLILGLIGDGVTDERRSETVRPLVGHQVVLAVQLTHLDALGIEDVGVNHLKMFILVPGSAQPRDGGLQHAIDGGLAAAGGTDEHRPEAHVERLVHLHHLRHELIHRL